MHLVDVLKKSNKNPLFPVFILCRESYVSNGKLMNSPIKSPLPHFIIDLKKVFSPQIDFGGSPESSTLDMGKILPESVIVLQ